MSLGLPSHLSRAATSLALAVAARWVALVCLVMAEINLAVSMVCSTTEAASWISAFVLVPMMVLLAVLSKRRTTVLTLIYLVVGAVCTGFYVHVLFHSTPAYRDAGLFVVSLPIIAMTLVGGTGTSALAGILWATLGFALAEAAVFVGSVVAERVYKTDAISLGAYLLLVGVLVFGIFTRGSRSWAQSVIHRAVRDARLVDLRREILAESTADLHDTVLSELAAVALATPGELPNRLRRRIEAGLHLLGGAGAPADAETPVATDPNDSWYDSELRRAIEDARDEGLTIDISGDRDAVIRLSEDSGRAVGLAVRQCLINVLRHSGSATAEIALSSSEQSVSVMVVDEGRGFTESATGADRVGLRQSVNGRISNVGGSVTVYSSEDVGTTVILTVPVAVPA